MGVSFSVARGQFCCRSTPALMRVAAQRYIQHHAWAGEQEDPALRITLSDIASLWPGSQDSFLVLRLLKECAASPLQYGGSTGPDAADVYLRPSLDSLRHEHVETLEDVFRAEEGPERVPVGRYPASNHLRVLQLIWADAEKNGAWPTSLPFAIENRNIGDVRQIVHCLTRFSTSRDERTEARQQLTRCQLSAFGVMQKPMTVGADRDRVAHNVRSFFCEGHKVMHLKVRLTVVGVKRRVLGTRFTSALAASEHVGFHQRTALGDDSGTRGATRLSLSRRGRSSWLTPHDIGIRTTATRGPDWRAAAGIW